MKMVSLNVKLASMLLIGLVVGLAIGYSVSSMQTPAAKQTVEYPIGVITELTGGIAEFGRQQKIAALLAVDDMNALLAQANSPVRFKAVVADDQATSDGGAKAVASLVETSGVQVIAGPGTTSCALGMKSYVDSHHIPVLTSTSTGVLLSVPDYISRMWASDKFQGRALVDLANYYGVQNIVIVHGDEPYGNGIRDLFKTLFKGSISDIAITPGQADYASEVANINREVENFGANEKTAVVVVITGESTYVNMLGHAASYPSLAKVKWIASDAVNNPGILPPSAPPSTAEYLMQVQLIAVTAHYTANALSAKVMADLKAQGSTDPSGLYMYDAAYLAMLSVLAAGRYDGEAIAKVLPTVASHYYGASGWKLLDENGDCAYQQYDVIMMSKDAQGYAWATKGLWDPVTGLSLGQ